MKNKEVFDSIFLVFLSKFLLTYSIYGFNSIIQFLFDIFERNQVTKLKIRLIKDINDDHTSLRSNF